MCIRDSDGTVGKARWWSFVPVSTIHSKDTSFSTVFRWDVYKRQIASLIPRFGDVEQGEICIGGVDIRRIATAKLMDMVSFVFQDTFLFYDTLYENITVGSPVATKEKVIAAAKAAQCHDFIEKLPQGYETRIGDKEMCIRDRANSVKTNKP